MQPKVSVVIPSYNNAEFIGDTLRSVLAQTWENLEVIVADHSSTDATMRIVRQFDSDPRVRVLTTPSGGGAVRNWNRVTSAASGDFVKLVCGDDLIYPDCVEKQVQAFATGVDMVAARRDVVDASGVAFVKSRGLPRLVGRIPGLRAVRKAVVNGTNVFGEPASVMFRTEALHRAGLWSESEHYLIDEATYVAVLKGGDFVGIPESLGAFRVSSSQWSVRLAKSQAAETIAFHKKVDAEFPGLLSRRDLTIGNNRARALARVRRLVYFLLSLRRATGAR